MPTYLCSPRRNWWPRDLYGLCPACGTPLAMEFDKGAAYVKEAPKKKKKKTKRKSA